MSQIKTKIRTYNDVVDLFGEEKAADMLPVRPVCRYRTRGKCLEQPA